MAKFFFTFASVLMCMATARCTNSKFVKSVPTITNSLVNLGKMDISFYFNAKNSEDPTKSDNSLPRIPNSRSLEAPCPCSTFKGSKDSFLTNPSDLINKILKNDDFFKDPSHNCCDSHEQIQEKTLFFELGPSRAPMINNPKGLLNSMKLPYPIQKALKQPGSFPMRQKAMEIFLFPKRKDIANFDTFKMATKPTVTKPEIKVVGDKEIKPINDGASVKKDLTSMLEKREPIDNHELKVEEPPTTVNNAL